MTDMDTLRLEFRDQFRSHFMDDFQSWFENIACALHPNGDFQAIRVTQGDGGFDGFVINSQIVYQVYAPARIDETKDTETANKISADFLKVCSRLGDNLNTWIFVHNHPTAQIGHKSAIALSNLKATYPTIDIRVLNIDAFWDEVSKLPIQLIASLLGVALDSLQQQRPLLEIAERFASITHRDIEKKIIYGMAETIVRSETGYIEDLLDKGKPVLMTGEAGVGKSGIAYALCMPCSDSKLPILYLDARKYSGVSCANDLTHPLGLSENFIDSVHRLGQNKGCRVVIDQVDSVASKRAGEAFIDIAKELSRIEKVQVVLLSRSQENYEHKLLHRLDNFGFERIQCNPVSDTEARDLLISVGIGEPQDDLTELCQNLLNLDIVARMHNENPAYDFSAVTNEVELWEAYITAFNEAEDRSPHGVDFGTEILERAISLAQEVLKSVDKTVNIPRKDAHYSRMESWGIITHFEGNFYQFRYEKFRDYLYARNAVDNGLMLNTVLSEIQNFRAHTILVWMIRLYPLRRKSKAGEFLREVLNG